MSFLAELVSGGASGLLQGIGKAARDIRAAITGEEVLSAEAHTQRSAIVTLAGENAG